MKDITLFLLLGLFFSPLGAATAYIIFYEEYKKHVSKEKAIEQSLQMAIFTFFVFLLLAVIGGYLFSQLFASS